MDVGQERSNLDRDAGARFPLKHAFTEHVLHEDVGIRHLHARLPRLEGAERDEVFEIDDELRVLYDAEIQHRRGAMRKLRSPSR